MRRITLYFALMVLAIPGLAEEAAKHDWATAHDAMAWEKRKATVIFFVFTDCPIANNYAPEMNAIAKAYAAKGVACFRVYAGTDIAEKDVEKHTRDFGFGFPAVMDPDLKVTALCGARVTPEAVVFDSKGARAYRGRIDDRYVELGKYRPKATVHDLRDALDAVLAGKKVAVAETKAVGCFLPQPGDATEAKKEDKK